MFKHYFELLEGIDLYPIFSLIIFFIFFVCTFIWSLKADKKYLKLMEEIPLEKEKDYL